MGRALLSIMVMSVLVPLDALGDPGAVASLDTAWVTRVASRLAVPPVGTSTSVWVAKKGAVQAHSLTDGSRRFRHRVSGSVRLYDMGGDSVLALRRYLKGSVSVFGSDPIRLLYRHTPGRRILAADCRGSLIAVLLGHGSVGLLSGPQWMPKAFPRASVQGWATVQVACAGDDTVLVFSRRDGQTMVLRGDSLIALGTVFRGGVIEAAGFGDRLVLVGAEGTLALLDEDCSVVWECTLTAGLQFDPIVHDGRIWAALRNRRLVLIDMRHGEFLGDVPLSGPLSCPMTPWHDGVAWATFDGHVSGVFDTRLSPVRIAALARPPVGIASAGTRIVIACEDGHLVCLQSPAEHRER
ncbi:PQQ-binding-like beta-propeller repeat protein [Candidatus Fermentibacteria bacterium]|nr:PQQ-binding-like beta-propeller repeat protein [Candidatus Fermentibacteria bacterium]